MTPAPAAPAVRWIYLTAGSDLIFRKQAFLSIASLLARSDGRARVTLYTDAPAAHAWLASHVDLVSLDPALLARWVGPERFFFRAKPCLLLHHAERHPGEAVFYLDTDTLCTGDPLDLERRLLAGAFFLHVPEYRVCDGRTKERREYRRRLLDRPLPGGLALRTDSQMWNAGLLGLGPGDQPLVRTVLAAVDAMTALGLSPRTRLKEQLAFSLAAATTGRLQPIGDAFTHYWGNKAAWEAWTDAWLLAALSARADPLAAGRLLGTLPPPPPALAPRKSPAERRKAKLRKLLRLD
jgi:hypothetical protein